MSGPGCPAPTPSTTTTTQPTTSTTEPVDPHEGEGDVQGRILLHSTPDAPATGVPGIVVSAMSLGSEAEAVTDATGTYVLDGLPIGLYWVVAQVPAAYRPRDDVDPWSNGDTWTATLGLVLVTGQPLDLADLHLVPR